MLLQNHFQSWEHLYNYPVKLGEGIILGPAPIERNDDLGLLLIARFMGCLAGR